MIKTLVMKTGLAAAVVLPLLLTLDSEAAGRTMTDVLAASTPSDWRALDPQNTLYMDLPRGRVVIELAPEFAPKHVQGPRWPHRRLQRAVAGAEGAAPVAKAKIPPSPKRGGRKSPSLRV